MHAAAAGSAGAVAETVAINRALAISRIDILNQWYYNAAYLAIMEKLGRHADRLWSAVS